MSLLSKVHKSGFTLIELIFVIVIIGILTAIAIPKLEQVRAEAAQELKSKTSFSTPVPDGTSDDDATEWK